MTKSNLHDFHYPCAFSRPLVTNITFLDECLPSPSSPVIRRDSSALNHQGMLNKVLFDLSDTWRSWLRTSISILVESWIFLHEVSCFYDVMKHWVLKNPVQFPNQPVHCDSPPLILVWLLLTKSSLAPDPLKR